MNAKRDEPSPGSRLRTERDSPMKADRVGDHMVRWQQQHQRVGIACGQPERCRSGGRCRVAGDRLKNQGLGLNANLAQLLGDHKSVILIRDDQRRLEYGRIGNAQDRFLQQALVLNQRQELLGIG